MQTLRTKLSALIVITLVVALSATASDFIGYENARKHFRLIRLLFDISQISRRGPPPPPPPPPSPPARLLSRLSGMNGGRGGFDTVLILGGEDREGQR